MLGVAPCTHGSQKLGNQLNVIGGMWEVCSRPSAAHNCLALGSKLQHLRSWQLHTDKSGTSLQAVAVVEAEPATFA